MKPAWLKPTAPLDPVARDFWDRNAAGLAADGTMRPRDVDAFTALCQVWSKHAALSAVPPGADQFREMVQFNQLGKLLQAWLKAFGLTPRDRKNARPDDGEAADAPGKFGV